MEFKEVLERRYSCRNFNSNPVEREKINTCMEAGRISPSACNTQRWMFIAVDEPEKRHAISDALQSPPEIGINRFTYEIPAFIVVLRHPPRKELNEKQKMILSKVDHQDIDIGIAAQQICLTATSLGLGSIMLGWFNEKAIKEALKIPEKLSVALVIGVGYPQKEKIRQPGRYASEQVYRWNSYDD